jgi:hypothetical protein
MQIVGNCYVYSFLPQNIVTFCGKKTMKNILSHIVTSQHRISPSDPESGLPGIYHLLINWGNFCSFFNFHQPQ